MVKLFAVVASMWVAWLLLGRIGFMHQTLFAVAGISVSVLGLAVLAIGYLVHNKT